jgi:hypothetical protein
MQTILPNLKSMVLGLSLLASCLCARSQQVPLAIVEATGPYSLCTSCKQIDELAATEFFRSRLGSLTVGVVSGDKLVWTKSYVTPNRQRAWRQIRILCTASGP